MKRRIVVVAALIVAAFATEAWLAKLDAAEKNDGSTLTRVGDPVPAFVGTTLDGETVDSSKFEGKVVVLNFFATWCGPCRKELPVLKSEVWDKYRDEENFALWVIGREHTLAELETFKREEGFSMPLIPDPKRGIYGLFATRWIPRTYVIGRDGRIVTQSIGASDEDIARVVRSVEQEMGDETTGTSSQDR